MPDNQPKELNVSPFSRDDIIALIKEYAPQSEGGSQPEPTPVEPEIVWDDDERLHNLTTSSLQELLRKIKNNEIVLAGEAGPYYLDNLTSSALSLLYEEEADIGDYNNSFFVSDFVIDEGNVGCYSGAKLVYTDDQWQLSIIEF